MPAEDDKHWLEQPVIALKGIGEKLQERFARRKLFTLNDLLFHLPVRYLDKTRIQPIAGVRIDDSALVRGELLSCKTYYARRPVMTCQISDGSAMLTLRFFHFNKSQTQALARALEEGKWLSCFGEVKRGRQGLEMTHPEYRIIAEDQIIQMQEHLTPVYPTTEGLSQTVLRNAIAQVIQQLKQQQKNNSQREIITDFLSEAIRRELALPLLSQCLLYLHEPPPECSVFELTEGDDPWRQRLVLEELLAHQLSMKQIYQQQTQHKASAFRINSDHLFNHKLSQIGQNSPGSIQNSLSAQFLQQLPFKLTQAQQRVIQDIAEDMCQPYPMQRLVQGDVGSGKTVVAALSALFAIENRCQVALMAPTELLAGQHYDNFRQWFTELDINISFLSGKSTARERREALEVIDDGTAQMVIGTHALFQDEVNFNNLGLVIIDEQHRFGVHQRLSLLAKGKKEIQQSIYPHQLIMTATPIPRTLAMTAYADLDCSVIDELPPGRTPVDTVVIGQQRRDEVLARVHHACLNGRQAYWVCTLIEESEVLQCQAAEQSYKLLREQLPDLAIGLVHGRMKAAEKQAVITEFKEGQLALLVATTVIEVGVDVPNASLMIIENAERLGLSQLHQLRGRVGRGSQASACVLLYGQPLSKNGKARLMTLRETSDGFEVARKDLELRGPGEILGTRQTGLAEMKIADVIRDQHLIPKVNDIALHLLRDYPEAVTPIINRWIGHSVEYQNV